jgi:hypothetical protein
VTADHSELLTLEGLAKTRAEFASLEARVGELRAETQARVSEIRTLRSMLKLQEQHLRAAGLLEPADPMDGLNRYPRGERGVLRALADLDGPVHTHELLERAQETDAIDPSAERGADLLRATLHRLAKKGLAERRGRRWALTDAGEARAWELIEPIARAIEESRAQAHDLPGPATGTSAAQRPGISTDMPTT